MVGIFDRAVRIDDLDLAVGGDHPLGLVVDHLVGAQGAILVADLHMAGGGGGLGLVVAGDEVGLQIELAGLQAIGDDRRLGGLGPIRWRGAGRLGGGMGRAGPGDDDDRRAGQKAELDRGFAPT